MRDISLAQHQAKAAIGDFIAVAVGAMQHRLPPALREAGNARQLVRNAEGKHEPGALEHFTRRELDGENVRGFRSVDRFVLDERRRGVGRNLRVGGGKHRGGLAAVLAEKAVRVRCEAVPR